MTREEYKRAKRRWILQPLVGIAVFILLMFIAGGVASAVMPL